MSESTAKMMNVPMEMNCIIVMKESVMALAVLPICVTSILVTVDSGSEVSTVSSCTESIGGADGGGGAADGVRRILQIEVVAGLVLVEVHRDQFAGVLVGAHDDVVLLLPCRL